MNRLIISGSPRIDGRSAALAEMLFESTIEEWPDDELALAPVSTLEIAPCQNCGVCAYYDADEGISCVIEDDMQDLYELIDAADTLTVVAPVFFSGPSGSLKALLDRLQPYFYRNEALADADAEGKARYHYRSEQAKRPAIVHVVGEGGDPFGYAPLLTILRSSLACAGFAIESVFDWIGKIDADGTIVGEPVELSFAQALEKTPMCELEPVMPCEDDADEAWELADDAFAFADFDGFSEDGEFDEDEPCEDPAMPKTQGSGRAAGKPAGRMKLSLSDAGDGLLREQGSKRGAAAKSAGRKDGAPAKGNASKSGSAAKGAAMKAAAAKGEAFGRGGVSGKGAAGKAGASGKSGASGKPASGKPRPAGSAGADRGGKGKPHSATNGGSAKDGSSSSAGKGKRRG